MASTSAEKNEQQKLLRSQGHESFWWRTYVWDEFPSLAVGSLAMLISSWSNQSLPRLMGRLIDRQQVKSDNKDARDDDRSFYTSLGFVILGGGLASLIRTVLIHRVQQNMSARLREVAVRVLLTEKDVEWFHSNEDNNAEDAENGDPSSTADERSSRGLERSGDARSSSIASSNQISLASIISVVDQDAEKMASAFSLSCINLARSLSTVVYSIRQMVLLDPSLFLASVLGVPAIGAAAVALRGRLRRLEQRQQSLSTAAASFAQERVLHINAVRLSNRQDDELREYQKLLQSGINLGRQEALWNGAYMAFLFVASSGALFSVVRLGGRSVASGKMTSGQLSSFATFSFLLGLGTSGVIKAAAEFNQGMVSAQRYRRVIDRDFTVKTKQVAEENKSVDVSKITSIRMENVHFSYRSSSDSTSSPKKSVLRDVSLELQRGKVVALVGANGSGKSTLASVLAGLLRPTSGRVALSVGTDLSDLGAFCRARLVHMLCQTTALFDTTILENVMYSNPTATVEQVQTALQQANCTEFLAANGTKDDDNGYSLSYRVGWNGGKLSGGQRQRLALARALLADPALLIMDEPSTSLDSRGQLAVAEAVQACRGKSSNGSSSISRALLLIVHHPKSLKWADEILVLKDGQIVERGSLTSLLTDQNKKSELEKIMPDLAGEMLQ